MGFRALIRGHNAVFDRRTRLTGEFGVMFLMTNARLKGVPRQKLAKTQQNSTQANTTFRRGYVVSLLP
jgi:hypothetical protein